MKSAVVEIVLWLILASLLVLVVMNPKGFASMVSSVGGFVIGESSVLTGSGYKTAK